MILPFLVTVRLKFGSLKHCCVKFTVCIRPYSFLSCTVMDMPLRISVDPFTVNTNVKLNDCPFFTDDFTMVFLRPPSSVKYTASLYGDDIDTK